MATSWLEAAELAADEADSLRRAMDERCSFARAPALAALPLLYGDRVHGALLAQAFAVEALPLLQELAARAAPAFDNAWLYRRLEKQIEVRIAAERELQAANRRKDEFLAMLSHELRNPMAPILSARPAAPAAPGDEPARSAPVIGGSSRRSPPARRAAGRRAHHRRHPRAAASRSTSGSSPPAAIGSLGRRCARAGDLSIACRRSRRLARATPAG